MFPNTRRLTLFALLIALPALTLSASAGDDAKPALEISPRGGLLTRTQAHQFEVFFYPSGLRVYPRNLQGQPLDPQQLAGTATFLVSGQSKPWFSRALSPRRSLTGQTKGSLTLAMDLSSVPRTGVSVRFEVVGLGEEGEERVAFDLPFELVRTPAAPALSPQPAPTPTASVAPTTPPYVYSQGYYGVGFYPNQGSIATYGATPSVGPAISSSPVPVEKPWTSPHWSFDYADWMEHNL